MLTQRYNGAGVNGRKEIIFFRGFSGKRQKKFLTDFFVVPYCHTTIVKRRIKFNQAVYKISSAVYSV